MINFWMTVGLLVGFILFFLLMLFAILRKERVFVLDQRALNYVQSHWVRILDCSAGNMSFAVVEADKLLAYLLKRQGFNGSMAEALKMAKRYLRNSDEVWFAHRLRNKLAHELVAVSKKDGKRALAAFKNALNDLGANL